MPAFGDEAFGDKTFGDQAFGDEVVDTWSRKKAMPLLGRAVD